MLIIILVICFLMKNSATKSDLEPNFNKNGNIEKAFVNPLNNSINKYPEEHYKTHLNDLYTDQIDIKHINEDGRDIYMDAKYIDDKDPAENDTNGQFLDGSVNWENYTSCEEFVANTTFDPKSVIDIDWKIFYLWDFHPLEAITIRFSVPSKSLVEGFARQTEEIITSPVNWTNADLFMETSIDFGGLLIRGNISGLYRLIPSLTFQAFEIPHLNVAFKFVPPGYLGMEACEVRKGYALAPVNKMPHHEMLAEEAKKIGFRSEFGYSYIDLLVPPMESKFEELLDDDEEEEAWEIEHNEYVEMF